MLLVHVGDDLVAEPSSEMDEERPPRKSEHTEVVYGSVRYRGKELSVEELIDLPAALGVVVLVARVRRRDSTQVDLKAGPVGPERELRDPTRGGVGGPQRTRLIVPGFRRFSWPRLPTFVCWK